MTNGKLTLDEGLISVSLPATAAIDAAASGDMGGIEFEVDHTNITIGPRTDFRAPLTLSISLHPFKMTELGLTILEKVGRPGFNDRQWRVIANALRVAFKEAADNDADYALELHEIASTIERACPPAVGS